MLRRLWITREENKAGETKEDTKREFGGGRPDTEDSSYGAGGRQVQLAGCYETACQDHVQVKTPSCLPNSEQLQCLRVKQLQRLQ